LALATSFLTVLPTPPATSEPGGLARASYTFPVVGALVGTLAAAVGGCAAWLGLPGPLAAGIAIVAMVMMTGALHEDGFADCADALGAGADRDRALDIMRDSRMGAFGGLALILSMALRWGALAALPGAWAGAALIAGAAVSRMLMVNMMRLPQARADGLGAGAGRPDDLPTLISLLIGVFIAFLALPFWGAMWAIIGAVLAAAAVAGVARRRFGGKTGDVLGAGQQAAEIGFLLALAAALN
jgi:adenosylcobinamide-GDP ribazoletransferase